MLSVVTTIPIFIALAAIIWGLFWAIYVFSKQQKFNRLQNLSKILQRFGDKEEIIGLFNLFDQSLESIDRTNNQINYNNEYLNQLSETNSEVKFQFLVILEEVALYAKSFEVDRDFAVHLFQFHFYYVYVNPETSAAFWKNLGGLSESNQHYWSYQKNFSVYCKPF